MDTEAVIANIKALRNHISINLTTFAQRELEGVFVHRDLVLHQIATLDAVLEDSIKLQRRNTSRETQFALLQPSFLNEQLKNLLQAVIQDIQWLGEAGVGSRKAKLRLQTTSDAFILKMMLPIYGPAIENIDICTASESEVDVHSLNVMHPEFVKSLMCWFMTVTQSHVAQNKNSATYMESRDSAESTMAALREEAATLRAAEAGTQTKMLELEAGTRAKMQELEAATRTKVTELEAAMRAKMAELEATTRARVAELEATVGGLQQQKTDLEETLKTSQLLLGNLAEEKRQLEERSKASEATACAALEAAQAEAATMRAISADCGRKIAEQIVQLTRFQELVDARDNELAALKVKPVTSSHESQRGSPSGAPTAGSSRASRSARASGVSANAGNEDAGDEEEEKDEQEEIEEDDKSESKDEEDEEEFQVDEEMKDATEVLEAELQDTKAKLQAALEKVARLEVEVVLYRDGPFHAGEPSDADQIPPPLVSVNLAALALLALPHRARELAKLPEVAVDLPPHLSGMYGAFTRASIRKSLGGAVSKFIVRCTNSQTELARKMGISSFLCLNMDNNPWLPAAPGRHGYVQAYDQDLKPLLDGQTQHVFIGVERHFCYYGEYRIRRVDDLTPEEWSMLPLPTRVRHAESTLGKRLPALADESLSTKDVFERYEEGRLRLPCVQLECIGFDIDFYGAIVGENRSYEKYENNEDAALTISISRSSVKRRRGEDDHA